MQENETTSSSEKVLILPLSEDSKKITQILSNDKAMKVLEILTDKPMSATDVAEKMGMPLTTVKYNIDALVEVDLIKVKQTKWSKKGREIKIYEPVQKFIVVAPGSMKDKSSVLSMLKKYLALVAGAVFGATGLEALARSRGFGIGAAPSYTAADAAYRNTEYVPMADVYESASQEMPGYEPLMANGSAPGTEESFKGLGIDEDAANEAGAFETTAGDAAAGPDYAADNSALDGYVPEDMDPGLVSSMPQDTFDSANMTGAPAMDSSRIVADNLSAASDQVSGLIPYDLLSHVSVWFLFGCLFIITLLLVRELYYRKKNI